MENARLLEELRQRTRDLQESLEYQTATSDVLNVISRSTFDLQPVLDMVARTAARLCKADQSAIYRRDGDSALLVANCGFPPEYETYTRALGAFPIDPKSVAVGQRTLVEGRPVHVHDVVTVPGYWEVAITLGKQRTSLGVPLLHEGATIGNIMLARQRVEPFTDRQIELVRTFADQAVIAIENTRLLTETREALEQQTATAEVLEVINASPGDLAPVFDELLDKALDLCESPFGILATYDGEFFHVSAHRGSPQGFVDLLREPFRPSPGMNTERLLRGEALVHVLDLTADEMYRSGNPTYRALRDQSGARTAIWIALRRDNALLGMINIYRREVRPFSHKQIALLQNFAAQAVIAMENARLLTETREALEQQTATAEVLGVINSSPGDLTPVFDAILEKAHGLCDIALGELELHEDSKFRAVAMRGVSGPFAELLRQPFAPPPHSPLTRLLAGEPIVQITDLLEVARERPDDPRAQAGAQFGLRTVLFVPLRKDNALLGYITAYRKELRPFLEKEIALLQNFAAQAVIAIENTRLLTETREALEQQTATAEVLQVINSSPGDLAPVFDAMLEKAMRLCDAAFGALATFDGTTLRTAATRGVPPEYARFRMNNPPVYGPKTAPGRMMAGERLIHNIDLKAEDAYREGDPNRRALVDLGGARSALQVALRKDDALLGSMTIYRQEVRAFTDKQIGLLENFAAQAVIAMENARLITETREALEQQTATAEVLQVINSSPGDLVPVFNAILEKAHTICGAEYGVLLTYDGELFWPVAVHGHRLADSESVRRGIRPGFGFGRLVRGERFLHIHDMAEVAVQNPADPVPRALVETSGIRTQLAVPLRRDDKLLGMITANRRQVHPFSEREIVLIESFAAQAVIAMENARLITETREALEQQTATAEVLQVINSSPGNLVPVFDAMLNKATGLCRASFGILWRFDDKMAWPEALHQVPAGFAEFWREPGQLSAESGPGRMMRGENAQAFSDIAELPLYAAGDPATRAIVDLAGARSSMIAPLRKDGATLGAITIYRQEVRPFTDKEIALLENFAAQAVIAMENARLLTETREALEQQTATAEVLQVINGSPGSLAPVFDSMLEKAMRLCSAAFGSFYVYDGEQFLCTAQRGLPPAFAAFRAETALKPEPGSDLARAMETGQTLQAIDLMASDLYRRGNPFVRAMVELGGVRTILTVPLCKDGSVLGFVSVYRQEVKAFSYKQIGLLENFAAQAVIAMENARLLTETREALEQQTATAEVLQVINASPGDLVPVFDAILEKAHSLCHVAQGSLELYDGGRFRAVAVRGLSDGFADMLRQGYPAADNPATRPLIEGRRYSHIRDVAETDYAITQTAAETSAARTLLCIPLRRDDALLGMIASARREVRPFSEKEIALLENFAAQAVIAMENARLLTELQQRTEELARRNSEYGERIEHQSATIDVLQAMSASPGDAQPVFDLITRRAKEVCNAPAVMLFEYDGELVHFRSECGGESGATPGALESYKRLFPMAPTRALISCRAILDRQIIEVRDMTDEPDLLGVARDLGHRANLAVPLLRDGAAIGAIGIISWDAGGFPDSQVELMKTFAEQAVIAITSAGTYRELQERTAALALRNSEYGERIEHQSATIDVLQAMSASPGDPQPVFDLITRHARDLCNAPGVGLAEYDGTLVHIRAECGTDSVAAPGALEVYRRQFPMAPTRGSIACRAIMDRRIIHLRDLRNEPDLLGIVRDLGHNSQLAVPLLRDGAAIGVINVASREVGGFSDSQVELMKTFAEQAVIAISSAATYRELQERTAALALRNSEYGERIEQQSATIDVLKIMSASPDDTQPVFDQIVRRARELCNARNAALCELDDGLVHVRAHTKDSPDTEREAYIA
jgi:GAF domain-containing protein